MVIYMHTYIVWLFLCASVVSYNFRIIGDSQFNSRTSLNHGEELDTVTTNAPVDTPVKEPADVPVKRADDFPAIYEEIPLTTSQPSEDETANQPGITCASTEWQNEPIYLEPREQCAQTTSPTKIGPLGDIYAMPHAKGYDVTLPGNASGGSDAHPMKATAQNVVYARPVKTSKSPTANHPDGVIYSNLEAEVLDTEQTADNHDQTKKVRFTDDG